MTSVSIPESAALAGTAFVAARTPVIVALGIVCAAIAIAIPVLASKGKLHVPGYVGLAFISFALAFVCGRISGARRLSGSTLGLGFAILFFLLFAVAAGSFLAIFFYREPWET
jgi:hypothetical protein